jgi:hypothetical protein
MPGMERRRFGKRRELTAAQFSFFRKNLPSPETQVFYARRRQDSLIDHPR